MLKEASTGPLDIEGLTKLYTTAEPLSVLYYAAKYMLHRKLIDRFQERGQTLAAEREIYLLGQTWAEGEFTKYRDHARHGLTISAKLGPGRDQRNAEAKHEAQRRYAEWQRIANVIWCDHQDWSKSEVARHVKKRAPHIEEATETIAKKIRPPK